MDTLLVSGLINIETTLHVESFPVAFSPVRYPFFGVRSAVSGVGYNIAKALTALGHTVNLATLIGRDSLATLVTAALANAGIDQSFAVPTLEQTPQSVILYDRAGQRQVNTDLKDIQQHDYPLESFEQAIQRCSLAVLCNINFSRPLLSLVRQRGIPIVTDVHTITDLDDAYNRDFMAAADILFMSDMHLPCAPELWALHVQERYGTPIVVIGMGAQGALLAVKRDGFVGHIPAIQTHPVLNTVGAGDALLSAFVDGYLRYGDPYVALRRAVVFASYKVGADGGANGFLDAAGLEALCATVFQDNSFAYTPRA